MKTRTYRTGYPSENIEETAERMVKLVEETKSIVTYNFNGIAVSARPGKKAKTIVKNFDKELRSRQGG